jgi:hypothetical protein
MKNPFERSTVEPILVGASTLIILQFLIFPGLSTNNTTFNLLSSLGILLLGLFLYQYVNIRYGKKEEEEIIEPGETELDYVPKHEVPKKKKPKKKKPEVKAPTMHVVHKSVKPKTK